MDTERRHSINCLRVFKRSVANSFILERVINWLAFVPLLLILISRLMKFMFSRIFQNLLLFEYDRFSFILEISSYIFVFLSFTSFLISFLFHTHTFNISNFRYSQMKNIVDNHRMNRLENLLVLLGIWLTIVTLAVLCHAIYLLLLPISMPTITTTTTTSITSTMTSTTATTMTTTTTTTSKKPQKIV